MEYNFATRVGNLAPSGIRKVNEKALAMERQGEQVLHFEIGRPDFDTPQYIKQAAIESLKQGDVFYTSNFGYQELRRQIANYLEAYHGLAYELEEVLVTVGLSEAIFDLLSCILDPGDEILVPDPVWINYMNVPRFLGANPVTYGLREENEYQIDIDELEGKISERTKCIVLISPNNPTGSVLSKDTLTKIADIAKKYNLLVLSDEVYNRIVFDGEKAISIGALPGMKERTITLNGFSKAYSMTGWRIGYVAAPKEFIVQMNKVHQHNVICAPSFVQKAAIEALRSEQNEVKAMNCEYEERRDYAVEKINQIKDISCCKPKGAFYIFVNIKKLAMSSVDVAEQLLEQQRIAFVPGSVFGELGEGYLRMSFANSLENIIEGCERLELGIEQMGGK